MDNQPSQPTQTKSDQLNEQLGSIPTQQFFQASAEPNSETPVVSPPTPQPVPKKSKKGMVIALIVLLVIAGVAAWYFLMGPGKGEDKTPVSSSSQTVTEEAEPDETAETKDITYTTPMRKASVSFAIPATWKVETSSKEVEDAEDITLVTQNYTTDKGNVLTLETYYGKGGSCDPDKEAFTLLKKVPTQTSLVEFRDYDIITEDDSFAGYEGLRLNVLDAMPADIQTMKDGDTATNTCENIAGFSSYEDLGVSIQSAGKVAAQGQGVVAAKYADIAEDTELIAVLQSMKFSKE